MPSLSDLATLHEETRQDANERARDIRARLAGRTAQVAAAVQRGRLSPQQGARLGQQLQSDAGRALADLQSAAGRALAEIAGAAQPDAGAESLVAITDALFGGGAAVGAGIAIAGGAAAAPALALAAPIAVPIIARRTLGPTYERARGVGEAAETSAGGLLGEAIGSGLDMLFGSTPESRARRAILEAPTPAARLIAARQANRRAERESRRAPHERVLHMAAGTLGSIAAIAAPASATAKLVTAGAGRLSPAIAAAVEAKKVPLVLRSGAEAAGFAVAETVSGHPERAGAGAVLGAAFPLGGRIGETVLGKAGKVGFAPSIIGAMTYAETGDLPTAIGAMLGVAPFAALGAFEGKRVAKRPPPGAKVGITGKDESAAILEAPRESGHAPREPFAPTLFPPAARPGRASMSPEARARMETLEGEDAARRLAGYETPAETAERFAATYSTPTPDRPRRFAVEGAPAEAIQRVAGLLNRVSRRFDPRRALTAPALPAERLSRALDRVPGAADLAGEDLGRAVVAWAEGRPGPSRGVRVAEDEQAAALRGVLTLEAGGQAPELAAEIVEAYFGRNGARPASVRRALLAAAERVVEPRAIEGEKPAEPPKPRPAATPEPSKLETGRDAQEEIEMLERSIGAMRGARENFVAKQGSLERSDAARRQSPGTMEVIASTKRQIKDFTDAIGEMSARLDELRGAAQAERVVEPKALPEGEGALARAAGPRAGEEVAEQVRQPWEMTREEFASWYHDPERVAGELRSELARRESAAESMPPHRRQDALDDVERYRDALRRVEAGQGGRLTDEQLDVQRRGYVEDAAREGRQIPPSVLSDIQARMPARALADPTPVIRRTITARASELVDADVSTPTARREVASLLKTGGKDGPDAGHFTKPAERTLGQAAKDLLRAIARDVWATLKGGEAGFLTLDGSSMSRLPGEIRAEHATPEAWGRFREAVQARYGTKSSKHVQQARELAHRVREASGLSETAARAEMKRATGKSQLREMSDLETARAAEALRKRGEFSDPAEADDLVRQIKYAARAYRKVRAAARESTAAADAALEGRLEDAVKVGKKNAVKYGTTRKPPDVPEKLPDGEVPPDEHGLFGPTSFDQIRNKFNVFRGRVERQTRLGSRVVAPIIHYARSLMDAASAEKERFHGAIAEIEQATGTNSRKWEWKRVSDIMEANASDLMDDTLGFAADSPEVQIAAWLRRTMGARAGEGLHGRFGTEDWRDAYVPHLEDFAAWDVREAREVFRKKFGGRIPAHIDAWFKHRREVEFREDLVRDPRVWFGKYVDRGFRSLLTPELKKHVKTINATLKPGGKFASEGHRQYYGYLAEWFERLVGLPSRGEIRFTNISRRLLPTAQAVASLIPKYGERLAEEIPADFLVRIVNGAVNIAYPAFLGLAPYKAIRNVMFQLPMAFAVIGPKHTLEGFRWWVANGAAIKDDPGVRAWAHRMVQGGHFERETGITSRQYRVENLDDASAPGEMRRWGRYMMSMFDGSEVMNRTIAFRGGQSFYREAAQNPAKRARALRRLVNDIDVHRIEDIEAGRLDLKTEVLDNTEVYGIFEKMSPSEQAAFEYGRSLSAETQFLMTPETAPDITRSTAGRAAFQFQSYWVNYADWWLGLAQRGGRDAAAVGFKYLVSGMAMMWAAEAITNAPSDEDQRRLLRRWGLGRPEEGLARERMLGDFFTQPIEAPFVRGGLPVGPVPQAAIDAGRLLLSGMADVVTAPLREGETFRKTGAAASRVRRDVTGLVPGAKFAQQIAESFE